MAIDDQGGRQVIPPPKNARLHHKDPAPCLLQRNAAVKNIREKGEEGRKLWKEEIGYHKRFLVETFMFRLKTIMGCELSSRIWENQMTEAMVKRLSVN